MLYCDCGPEACFAQLCRREDMLVFEKGQLLVYGTTGVCRVEDITTPDTGPGRGRQYYLLKPLQQDGVIYAPVDSRKVPIRPIISRQEAEALIGLIPSIRAEACHAPTLQALAQHYQNAVHSHDCRALLELTMSIYAKRCQAEQHNRRLGLVDERYGRHAERLLFGELAAALGLPYDEVPGFLFSRGTAKA